jgi:hypothetical protein
MAGETLGRFSAQERKFAFLRRQQVEEESNDPGTL